MYDKSSILNDALEGIIQLRRWPVRVHSITNTVAQNFTANVLLACGAKPSMTVNPDEVAAFTKNAEALHINLGTLDKDRIKAINRSCAVAAKNTIPVLLDPVMAHVSPSRCEFAAGLIKLPRLIVRANHHEVNALNLNPDAVSCLVVTGPVDRIITQQGEITIHNGDPMMAKITATGCALGALICALAARSENAAAASLAGLAWFAIAGELAADKSAGPGSFQTAFLDALHDLPVVLIRERLVLK